MWELDYKESWVPKDWCFWTVVLEKTLESPSDCKEIQSIHPKGDQSWIFIGRTDVEDETLILWSPDAKSRLIWRADSSSVHGVAKSQTRPRDRTRVSRIRGRHFNLWATREALPMNIQDWFPLGWTGWISLQSEGLSRVFSNTTVQKYQFFSTQLSL